MEISKSELSRVEDLYNRGLYLQAYQLAQTLGPLNEWEGTAALLLAGRLAFNLGAPLLARQLHARAWRRDRTDLEACYYYARLILERRGPLTTWRFLRKHKEMIDAAPHFQAEWMAFHGLVLGQLRDFDAAEEWLARAEKTAPDSAWICVERTSVLELEDRYDEALSAARRALELHPWYRPGVQASAQILALLDRDTEALKLLEEASQRIECGWIVVQLAQLQTDLGRFAEAQRSMERFVELSPMMEKEVSDWLNSRLSDAAYHCDDFVSAATLAEASNNPFHQRIAKRLAESAESGVEGRRQMLPVGFVRQHHMTCAPATLSAISRLWSMPADHLSVAEEICYDGTPAHSERKWAEQNGWVAREFRVTWASAQALLDRGVAFTLTTVEPANAHLQAVIGYDSRRGTLLIRDPYIRSYGEFAAEEMLERYASTGPRGMALVPREKAALLNGLDLPEMALYDLLYQLQQALAKHDRARASVICQAMADSSPEHRLTLQAQLALASYDADQIQQLSCFERLLKLYPDDANLKLSKLSSLRNQARRNERMTLLEDICEQKDSDPLFWQQYAQELSSDARKHGEAIRLLRRTIRYRPLDPGNFYVLANVLWSQRRFDEALELYRFAACLNDKEEVFATSYFVASRHFKQTANVLLFLESRFKRFGHRSSNPARTLFWAHTHVGQTSEAFAVLDRALQLRPEDGELMLFAADAHARYGGFEVAAALLARAEGKSQRSAFLRTAAAVEMYRGELAAALSLWRQVLEIEPLALDANRYVAQLLAETEGRAAALEYLRQVATRFPHNCALHQLWAEWLREDPAESETVLRRLIEIDPMDAWAHRELAIMLGRQKRFDDAFAEIDHATQLEPASPYCFCVRGKLLTDAGRPEEAKAAFQEAIRLSVDMDYAIAELMTVCRTPAERREALAFVQQELVSQVTFGDGLLAYREQARNTLEPEELRASLCAALKDRPDLWHAWSAVICQSLEMQQFDEALRLAHEATERFPLVPRLWFDLSLVCKATGDRGGEIDALQHALQINPSWDMAVQQLADAFGRAAEWDKSRLVLEQALARSPLDPFTHGCLADVLWRVGEKEEALKHVERALTLEPGYDWGWRAVRDWSSELNCADVAAKLARELTQQRSGEPRSWLVLARTLTDPKDLPERLAALDRAIALEPKCVDAYSLRACLLAEAGRFDEAVAACRPEGVWADRLPAELRSAAAWVEAERGDAEEAVKQLRALVADEPDYYPAWQRLADWYRATEGDAEYLEVARVLVRLAPHDPLAFGYLGDARLRNGDPAGAKTEFRRALNLAPDYEFAGRVLFDLQLEENDHRGARETLDILIKYVGDEHTTAREIQLAAKRKDLNTARERLQALCFSGLDDRRPLDVAVAAMVEAHWDKAADQTLEEALESAGVNPNVAAIWVERSVAQGHWGKCQKRIGQMTEKGEAWRRASNAYLESLANAKSNVRLRWYILNNKDLLRSDTQSWGHVGYALETIGDHQGARKWLSDWAERQGLEPWMLWNLALALRYTGRQKEAYAVGERALTLPPDYFSNAHALLLALDEALAGNFATAAARADAVDRSQLRAWDQFFYQLVSALLHAGQSGAGLQGAPAEALEHVVRMKKDFSFMWVDRLLSRSYLRCVWHLARANGSLFAATWAFWRLFWAYLFASLGNSGAQRQPQS